MTELKIHPAAEAFRMMNDEELAELAADIKANGLRVPIVLDQDEAIVDGRNRLKACELAEVEPRFERLDGEDAAALVVSLNVNRRNLSKG